MSAVLTVMLGLPLVGAAALCGLPRLAANTVKAVWVALAATDLAVVVGMWVGYRPRPGIAGGLAYEVNLRWVPGLSAGYHLGVDGLSLPLLALSAGLFLACALYSLRDNLNVRSLAALFLLLETTCLGVFSALDGLLFFVFFDLSIVVMAAVIAGWGHEQARAAAGKFFLYTFTGSVAVLIGLIGLFVAARPHTFDLVALARHPPIAGNSTAAAAVLLALGLGFAVKTPTVPFHTWLPLAHTQAPAAGSAILAGVLLKMGTYGFVRIAMPILPDTWRRYALVLVVIGALSALYGALVALAQTDVKRMIAYTSVNHMGFVVLAIGAAGLGAHTPEQARTLAVTGAVTQMVSHGLVTGALFLLTGALHRRGRTYDMTAYGGIAATAPVLAGLTALAAFASIGLPGFSGFVAEFQIFTGSLPAAPVAAAVAVLAIAVSAGLFLRALQRVFLGPPGPHVPVGVADLRRSELFAVLPLLAASVTIGLAPRFLLDVIEPSAHLLGGLVGP